MPSAKFQLAFNPNPPQRFCLFTSKKKRPSAFIAAPQSWCTHFRHDQRTGVADGGCARIRYQRNRLALGKQLYHLVCCAAFIVLVQGQQTSFRNAVMGQKMGGIARVFGCDGVCAVQHIQRTQANITHISNWGGDYI